MLSEKPGPMSSASDKAAGKPKVGSGAQQMKLFVPNTAKSESASSGPGPGRSKSSSTAVKKLDTKVLEGTCDPLYSTDEESDDGRKGGRKMHPLLPKISKPCHKAGTTGPKIACCIGSKGCGTTWGWPRDKTRILKHAAGCGYLAKINQTLVQDVVEELARKRPGLVNDMAKKVGLTKKRTYEDLTASIPEDVPSLKRSKTEPVLLHAENQNEAIPTLSNAKQVIRPGNHPFTMFQTEGKKALKERADQALVEFIICCGIPPRVLEKKHFRRWVNLLNGNYLPPSRTTFEDSLVPSYAAAVRVITVNFLKKSRDLMLSFDGGKLGKKKFYSVHATTPNRQSFCLELDDVSFLSQTGEYIFELLQKVHHSPKFIFSSEHLIIIPIVGIEDWYKLLEWCNVRQCWEL